MRARDFLTREEQQEVEKAIAAAETCSSGEIRIHIENKCNKDPREKALAAFHRLGMTRTRLKNGVLIYVAVQSRVHAVIGDRGINEVVPKDFWNDVCGVMAENFSAGRNAEGLSRAVMMIGEKLRAFFPYQEDDINELSDEISFHDNDGEDG